ncbi:MAG: GNAT family N-acetyltransferase [Clostridiales Family XIII bacterium]|jgi:GNAT superfamily N-acetyltransferase|nr:GNAT family N-acetyltransferase [Clostridiales Family XIII bacterium]
MGAASNFTIREAAIADCPLILEFIRALARYEDMAGQVAATEETLRESLFRKKQAEAIIGEEDGVPAAFALFFHNFSTFLGKANLYLEDLYVKEAYRGRGYGERMLRRLGTIAAERDCGRLDWWCLDWNENSIAFYKKMGAVAMDEWTVYRMEGEALRRLADMLPMARRQLTPRP